MRSVLLFALIAATPALASPDKAPSSGEGTNSQAAEPKAEEKKICKRMAASESRMASKRVCMTAAEWKRTRAEQDR